MEEREEWASKQTLCGWILKESTYDIFDVYICLDFFFLMFCYVWLSEWSESNSYVWTEHTLVRVDDLYNAQTVWILVILIIACVNFYDYISVRCSATNTHKYLIWLRWEKKKDRKKAFLVWWRSSKWFQQKTNGKLVIKTAI